MNQIVDFDNPLSFPKELAMWSTAFEKYILDNVHSEGVIEGWRIESQLSDLIKTDNRIVKEFFDSNCDLEVAVHHCTRIISSEQIMKEGLITGGGIDGIADKRIRDLLSSINVNPEMIERIMSEIYKLWDRDGDQRTQCVHFQLGKAHIINDIYANGFASNIGGEILDFAIETAGIGLKEKEPYKRLYIMGTPSIVKFKCKLSDIVEDYAYRLIIEIIKYYVVKRLYLLDYEFCYTGMTKGSIPPSDIIEIIEIENYNN